ncbi:HlyD family secretion protein [Chloroflexota bacterium]
MKRRGIIGILLLGLILITAASCSGGAKETINQQPAEEVTVTADGNIKASLQIGLTFGSGGKVDKIYFKEGDKVIKGDVLAKLDTSALETALTQAKVAQAEAQVAVSQAEVARETAEYELEKAQDLYSEAEILQARQAVSEARQYLEYAQFQQSQASNTWDIKIWTNEVDYSEKKLRAAEVKLSDLLSTPDTREIAIKRLQLEVARQSPGLARQSLELAEQFLKLAQKQLDEATITAPFDGTVYNVGAKEGEFLSPAAFTERTIVELIDLSHMELTARVNELDIARVKTGQKVIISVDAMPEMKLEGLVTFISPVAREPGAVLFEDEDEEKEYEVKIDFAIPEDLPIRAGMSAIAEIIVE